MRFTLVLLACAAAITGCGKEAAQSSTSSAPQSPPVVAAPIVPPAPKVDKGPWDGPFGLKKGLTDDELKAAISDLKTPSFNVHSTEAPPKPHDSFDTYFLVTSAPTGLCKISAAGKTIQTSQFGDELLGAHKSLKSALIERYGNPTSDHNFLKSGSLWTESKYWMMSLLKKDRIVATIWEKKTEKNPKGADLPNDLDNILIETVADGTDSGHIMLRYAFTNEDACIAENKKERNKAL